MKVLIFDTETTGLPKTKIMSSQMLALWPHIVQFSYIIFDTETNKFLKIFDRIVKVDESVEITKENSDLHGITKEMTQEQGHNIRDIINEFMLDYEMVDLAVAHNLSFDINIIKVELMREVEKQKNNKTEKYIWNGYFEKLVLSRKNYCTLQTSIHICNIVAKDKTGKEYVKFPKLSELHEKLFQTIPKNLHNSLNDVLVTLRCYFAMTYGFDLIELSEEFKSKFAQLL